METAVVHIIQPDTIFQLSFKTEKGAEFHGNIWGGQKVDSIIKANPDAKDAKKYIQLIIK